MTTVVIVEVATNEVVVEVPPAITNIIELDAVTLPGTEGGPGGVSDHGALTGLADDDHTQYHNNARGDARYDALGAATTAGAAAVVSAAAATATAISTHEAAANPHPTYLTQAEGDAAFDALGAAAAAVATHAGLTDPHPTYLNQTEGDARYFRPASGTSLTDTDIPAAIARDAEVAAAYQPLDTDLTAWAGKTAPSGAAVGTTDTQTLTNKTLTAPAITSPTGIVKGDVGLGNVDNTADTAKPVSTAQQTALDLKANLVSPALTGTPTVPTAAPGTNTTQASSTAFVTAAVAAGGSGGMATDPLWDAAADLAVGTGANTGGKLSKGTAGQALSVNSGTSALEWQSKARVGDSWSAESALIGGSYFNARLFENINSTANFASSSPLTSGRAYLVPIWLEVGSYTAIAFVSAGTAASAPTAQWFALCDSDCVVLRATGDDTSTAWGQNTTKVLTLASGGYTVTTPGIYRLAINVTASTVPALRSLAPVNGISDASIKGNTGLTTPVANGTDLNAGASAPGGFYPYCWIA